MVLLSLHTGGCANRNSFHVTASEDAQASPGTYTIPPKLDIVLMQDTSGSMAFFNRAAAESIRGFLKQLSQQGWDYRLVIGSLMGDKAIHEVAASDFDGHSDSYHKPYPGAPRFDEFPIGAGFYRSPDQFSDFISTLPSNSGNGREEGFENILKLFRGNFGESGFLRPGARTVVVTIGNGDDTSFVNYGERTSSTHVAGCRRADGSPVMCEKADNIDGIPVTGHAPLCVPTDLDPTGGSTTCGSYETSLAYYQDQFRKQNPLFTFYAVASLETRQTSQGVLYRGTRYIKMAAALGGKSFSVFEPSRQVLDNLVKELQIVKKSYSTRYLFTTQAPNPDTIKVTKYLGGDRNQPVVIPQSSVDGWSYAGSVNQVGVTYAIGPNGERIYNSTASGYGILLEGSAQLTGNDLAEVDYKPVDARDSVSR
mgnify:CR=1 FL=1